MFPTVLFAMFAAIRRIFQINPPVPTRDPRPADEKPPVKLQRLWERVDGFRLINDAKCFVSSLYVSDEMKDHWANPPVKVKSKRRKGGKRRAKIVAAKPAERQFGRGSGFERPQAASRKYRPARVHRMGRRENLVLSALREESKQEAYVYALRKEFTPEEFAELELCYADLKRKTELKRVKLAIFYAKKKVMRQTIGRKKQREKLARVTAEHALEAVACIRGAESQLWQVRELTEGLSDRCQEVAYLLTLGYEQAEIAKRLGISQPTVSRAINLLRDILSAKYGYRPADVANVPTLAKARLNVMRNSNAKYALSLV